MFRPALLVVAASLLGACSPAPPPITIEPATLPTGARDVPYSVQLTSPDGTAPIAFELIAGDLPTGVALDREGLLSGRAITASTSRFTVRATDAKGRIGELAYELIIAPDPITVAPARLPDAVRGAGYLEQITAGGGNGPYSYAVVSGSLPAGLSMNFTGAVSGTPTSSGTSTFTVRATDALSRTGEGTVQLTVIEPSVGFMPTTLPNATVGLTYLQTLVGTGGTDPYDFALESGALPDGLTLTIGGELSGRPTTAGVSSFVVRVTDDDQNTTTAALTLTVVAQPLTISPASFPPVTVGTPFNQTLSATGGTAPYTFTITRGVLPPGLSFTTAGVLSGTPTGIITTELDITATDAVGVTSARSFTLKIDGAVITLSPTMLPDASVGVAYSEQLSADGGTGPYLFTLSGALPAGLSLSSSGLISGTPVAAMTSTFTVTAADIYSSTGQQQYVLIVQ